MDSAQCHAGIVEMSQRAASIRFLAPRSRGQSSTNQADTNTFDDLPQAFCHGRGKVALSRDDPLRKR